MTNGNGRGVQPRQEQPWYKRGTCIAALVFLVNALMCSWYLSIARFNVSVLAMFIVSLLLAGVFAASRG